ncbi:MAG: class I SAM-dependent rRNA methyltransferase [Bacteroidales bacterium]|nr:class I SAM-dependent rRNA methyltransferase [Bacteroidales bacterium]
MDTNIKIVLKSGKDQSVMRRHPWIFSGAIKKIYGDPEEGDVVSLFNNKDEFLAVGHYQPGSIAVRILSFEQEVFDPGFWHRRIRSAYNYRKDMGLTDRADCNVYRLVHAEGDNLPGLIIDYYNGHVVLQMHSVGMHRNLEHIVAALGSIYGEKLLSIYNKSESTLPFKAKMEKVENHFIRGNATGTEVLENGLKFRIDWTDGQKTGFFIDQRENRELLRKYAAGREVLNMFCYTGGFSVYALAGKAKKVHSVDSSAKAIDLVDSNVALNFTDTKHESFAVDAFKFMANIKNHYDLIILDPPAFAKHQNVLHNALQGYKRLNQVALEQIRSGGILFTFSCSQVVTKENFRKSVFVAAANAKREVRILHQLTQPVDHPVNIYHPEGEYLKGLVLYVE